MLNPLDPNFESELHSAQEQNSYRRNTQKREVKLEEEVKETKEKLDQISKQNLQFQEEMKEEDQKNLKLQEKLESLEKEEEKMIQFFQKASQKN